MSQPDHHLKPNPHISAMIVASIANHSGVDDMNEHDFQLRTNSHANMCVAGKHVYVLADSGTTATVRAFSPDMEAIETLINKIK